MRYVWRRPKGRVGLSWRDGEVIAGVPKHDIDRFFTGLLLADASTPLRLEASVGEVVVVEVDDLVAFLLAYAKVAFGGPRGSQALGSCEAESDATKACKS